MKYSPFGTEKQQGLPSFSSRITAYILYTSTVLCTVLSVLVYSKTCLFWTENKGSAFEYFPSIEEGFIEKAKVVAAVLGTALQYSYVPPV